MNAEYENLNTAFSLCEKDFSHSDLIEFLKCGSVAERQIAALELDTVNSQEEAEILISNLVGVDGKIREVVSIKINEFLHDEKLVNYFLGFADIFIEAVIDVNGNICRNIIDGLPCLKKYDKFVADFCPLLIKQFDSAFADFDRLNFKDRKFIINKIMFRLYWCLEAMLVFFDYLKEDDICKILTICSDIEDYTVREKVAKILSLDKSDNYVALKEKLKNDENYYVRRYDL